MLTGAEEELPVKNNDTDQYKATYLPCSVIPDVTIVVGGATFKEHSANLCSWSKYFDAALRSGMKEMENRTFEFQDEDAAEWEWIMALTAPLPSMDITKANVHTALEWFDRLGSDRGLNACDRFVCSDIVAGLRPETDASKDILNLDPQEFLDLRLKLDEVLTVLATGIQYRLSATKAACFEIIKCWLESSPLLFEVEQLTKVVSFLHDKDSHSALWSILQSHLPPSLSNGQQEDGILENRLLPALLLSEILRKDSLKRMDLLKREESEKIAKVRQEEAQKLAQERQQEAVNRAEQQKRYNHSQQCSKDEIANLKACIDTMKSKIDFHKTSDMIREAIRGSDKCTYARSSHGWY